MRKLIAVVMLVGGLLAGAGPAMATQFGNGDPLSLASSGVLIPYLTSAGRTAAVEVASPFDENFDLHLIFFSNTCVKLGSAGLPLSTNDIGFVQPIISGSVSPGTDGLVAIGALASAGSANRLDPLTNPIHSRVYEFSGSDGRSLVLEPIIIQVFGDDNDFGTRWSPLRTAATFFAPPENATTTTRLLLVCPRNTIQDGSTTNLGVFPIFFGTSFVFPAINPPFVAGPTSMSGFVYDVNEFLLGDVHFACDCLTDIGVKDISSVLYNLPVGTPPGSLGAAFGTYSEIFVDDPQASGKSQGSFTGYRTQSTIGSITNFFFGRLSNSNRAHLFGSGSNPCNPHSPNNSNLGSTAFPFDCTNR
jgi:hypothetical protein